MDEQEYYVIDEVVSAIGEDISKGDKPEIIEIRDSTTEISKTLVPQFGSDQTDLADGKIDTRRFTNIYEEDVVWLSWFSIKRPEEGGNWCKQYCDSYRNHRYSVNGENKKLSIGITQAISGSDRKARTEQKRSLIDRILRRKPKEEYYDIEVE